MAYLLDEKKLVSGSIHNYEERLNSQYSRFIEKTPSFVTYYNINNVESTVDNGFQNIEQVLGPNSPLRFNKVTEFPIYGIEQVILDLQDEEQGLDTDFESQGTIIPNTLQPYPSDFFIINYLDKRYVFQVISIAYDTIKSNNYYEIRYTIKSLTGDDVKKLELQTTEVYNCIFTNIGTSEKCLIRSDDVEKLVSLDSIYTKVAEFYKVLFYNRKYNCFILQDQNGNKLYDRYMTFFINKFSLFNQRRDYQSYYFTIEDIGAVFMMEYHKSIYQSIELQNRSAIQNMKYTKNPVYNFDSIFVLNRERRVSTLRLAGTGEDLYVPDELIERIASGVVEETDSIVWKTIVDTMHNRVDSIRKIDLETLEDYFTYMDDSMESFILVPILLYILRSQYTKFMSAK